MVGDGATILYPFSRSNSESYKKMSWVPVPTSTVSTFNRLNKEHILRIVDIQVAFLMKRLQARKIELKIDGSARKILGEAGFDPAFGARPLKRAIQNLIQNPIAKKILSGEIAEGDVIIVKKGREGLAFEKEH